LADRHDFQPVDVEVRRQGGDIKYLFGDIGGGYRLRALIQRIRGRLIAAGVQWRLAASLPWQKVAKNGDDIPQGAQVQLLDAAEARYVSRGGLKLQAALTAVGLDVSGMYCLDVGQSTGGFSDCLLQAGARHVVGIDVGHGQLHPRLQADPRITSLEGINARSLTAEYLRQENISAAFDLIVGDVSFISLTLVLPALVPLLRPDAHLLMLVKPQFELQSAQIGKGGIVRNAALYQQVEQRLRQCCAALALRDIQWLGSAISGGDGNCEFFIYTRKLP